MIGQSKTTVLANITYDSILLRYPKIIAHSVKSFDKVVTTIEQRHIFHIKALVHPLLRRLFIEIFGLASKYDMCYF